LAPHGGEARDIFRRSIFHSRNLLYLGFDRRRSSASRDIPAPGNPVSTGSIAMQLSRMGAFGT
jgi:hypothetical protein